MKYYTVTDPDKDITIIKINAMDPSTAEFDEYVEFLTKIYKKPYPFVLLFDVNEGKYLKAEDRIKLGKTLKDNETILRKNCRGIGYTNRSTVANIIWKGILLVSPLPVPNKTFSEMEHAIDWAEGQLSNDRKKASA